MQRIGLATPKAAFVNTSELKKRFREEHASRVAAIETAHPAAASGRKRSPLRSEWTLGERLGATSIG